MSLKQWRLMTALLLLPLFAAGCNSPQATTRPSETPAESAPSPAGESLKVVTTFLPMYLFTKAVAGDAAQVDILVQPGTEVHEYQSTPADVQAIAQADVVVENGFGIEEFLEDTIKSANNPNLKVIDASEGITPLGKISPEVNPTGAEGEDEEHAENPHVWLEPTLAAQEVENIRDGLIAADPANQATYQANAAAYIQKLEDLDRQFKERLQPFSDRTFITFHDAFPYLAKRYELKQVAIVAIPEDSLTPGDVQKTIAAVKQFKVKALFSEPGVDNKLLDSLSQDLNLQLRPLDSLEAGELDPQYYFKAMQTNLKTLEEAFK